MAQGKQDEIGSVIFGSDQTSGNAFIADSDADGPTKQDSGNHGEDFQEPTAIFGSENGDTGDTGAGTASPEISARTGRAKRAYTRREGGTRAKVPSSLDILSGIFLSLTNSVAAIKSVPEMEFDENEARLLAKASTDLLSYYQIAPTEAQLIWGAFFSAWGTAVVPRVLAYGVRTRREKKEAKPQTPPAPPPVSSAFPSKEPAGAPRPPNGTAPPGKIYDFTRNAAE